MANGLSQRVAQNASGKAVQAQSGSKSLENSIRAMEGQFELAMPRGAEAQQLVRDAITVLRQNPKLAQCDQTSFLGSLMTCAQLGLRPGVGPLGQAYILPMWNTKDRRFDATFILGYKGMLDLANRSKDMDMVIAREVHEGDTFDIDYGTNMLSHKPAFENRGRVWAYYAMFYRKGSSIPTFEFMTRQDAEEHRDKFAMAKNKQGQVVGPWRDHFDAMAKKTTVRKLFTWMPKNTDLADAMVADESIRLDMTPGADLAHAAERIERDDPRALEAAADDAQQNVERSADQSAPEGVDTATGEVDQGGWGEPGESWGGDR